MFLHGSGLSADEEYLIIQYVDSFKDRWFGNRIIRRKPKNVERIIKDLIDLMITELERKDNRSSLHFQEILDRLGDELYKRRLTRIPNLSKKDIDEMVEAVDNKLYDELKKIDYFKGEQS